MASEDIGTLYNTQMPGYEDAADIQAALKLYHYGSLSYDETNNDPTQLQPSSIAGHFQSLRDAVTILENAGIGSIVSATEPTSPIDGEIWVDSTSSAPIVSVTGIPEAGTAGQVLSKVSATNYDVEWATLDTTSYTPAVAGDWDTAPTTIASALDEIAARLRVIEGA